MFANSGAEAVENAVKIARYATGRPAVICFENGFHGRTLLTMTLTSKVKPYKYGSGPFAPEVYRMPYAYCYRCPFGLSYPSCGTACADYLEDFFTAYVAPESTAAVIAEPIQGEGGFVTPPPEYFPMLPSICQKYGIALIIDEVQTGAGRTGKMFAIDHWGIAPDVITLAKSLAGGLPLSSVTGPQGNDGQAPCRGSRRHLCRKSDCVPGGPGGSGCALRRSIVARSQNLSVKSSGNAFWT